MVNLTSDKNLDKHLKVIKSGEEITSLELATEGNGAKIKGDLEITGSIASSIGQFNIKGDYIVVDGGILYMINLGNRVHFSENTIEDIYTFFIVQNYDTPITTTNAKTKGMQTEIKGGTTTVGNNTYNSALLVTSILNDTSDSGSHIYKLIEGVATNTDITGWDELYLLHLTGASTFWVSNAGDVALAASKKLYLDGGGDTYISEGASDILRFYVGGDLMLGLDEANDEISMSATNYNMALADGTRFSATNSAYAGMILGYTSLLNDAADTSYSVTTSFVTVNADCKITFTAPPGGNVEIFASVFCKWTTNRWLQFGLSDNATYNALDVTHEHFIGEGDETDEMQLNHRWVITGLTPGTEYTYYLGAKSEQASRVTLYWGGDATGEYAPFIMKATALPATIYTG